MEKKKAPQDIIQGCVLGFIGGFSVALMVFYSNDKGRAFYLGLR